MRYGAGVLLILVGAILAFAVSDMVKGVDTHLIGYICMGVGVLALGFISQTQATNTSHKEVIEQQ